MQLPADLLHRTPEEIAHRIALGFLDEARVTCDRLRAPSDHEALHDFRVALRRLRSTLRTWKATLARRVRGRHRRLLRDVQRATGGGRDAEVALAWLDGLADTLPDGARPGHAWLCERLRARLGEAMDTVRGNVLEAFGAAEIVLRRRLETAFVAIDLRPGATPVLGSAAVETATRRLDRELADLLDAVRSIEDEVYAHDARIACKRLRYHIEPLRALLPEARDAVRACKALQAVLGDMNDAAVLRGWVQRARAHAPADAGPGIDFVTARNDARHHELHARLAAGWLEPAEREVHGRVAALIAALVAAGRRPVAEIERTYLLSGPPTLPEGFETREIEQGYLPVEGYEDRVRRLRTGDAVRHVRTIKLGQGLRRQELEHELDAPTFEALWALTIGRRIHKRRHLVGAGAHVWEVDEFLDRDLWLAEVELSGEREEAVPPAWLAAVLDREVTDTPAYANRQLAR